MKIIISLIIGIIIGALAISLIATQPQYPQTDTIHYQPDTYNQILLRNCLSKLK